MSTNLGIYHLIKLQKNVLTFILVLCSMLAISICLASEDSYTITIKDHKFQPAALNIPAGQKIKLTIDNQDSTPEEFESYALNREKVVAGGKKIIVFIGPLKPGSYEYIGEFHKETAKGVIVAQ